MGAAKTIEGKIRPSGHPEFDPWWLPKGSGRNNWVHRVVLRGQKVFFRESLRHLQT